MYLTVMAVIALGTACLPLKVLNHVVLISAMSCEHIGNKFVASLASLDLIGDGFCDLALGAPIWPQGHTWHT